VTARARSPRARAALALLGLAAAVAPGPAGLASRASPAASRAFLSGYAVGVNVRAESLADGLPAQPTGRALADLLRARGIRMVRLLAPPDLRRLGPAPWTTLFDALSGIRVLLTLTGDPQALRTGVIANPQAFASREIEQIDEIRREQGGALPGTLVAIDVANEPLVTPDTVPALRAIAMRVREASGLPVTIGGWRAPGGPQGRSVFNRPIPAVVRALSGAVDFLSVHVYPDLEPGADRQGTDPAPFEEISRPLLQAVLDDAGGIPVFVEEFGGGNGLGPTPHGTWGSPAHQRAVIDGVLRAMAALRGRGVIGGTAWVLAPPPWEACDGAALVCYTPPAIMPGLDDLGRAGGVP